MQMILNYTSNPVTQISVPRNCLNVIKTTRQNILLQATHSTEVLISVTEVIEMLDVFISCLSVCRFILFLLLSGSMTKTQFSKPILITILRISNLHISSQNIKKHLKKFLDLRQNFFFNYSDRCDRNQMGTEKHPG